jgi:Uma2 family endonuclease
MPDMSAILSALARAPNLRLILDEANDLLAREGVDRERYRVEVLGRHDRAEFINGEVVSQIGTRAGHADVARRLLMLLSAFCTTRRFGRVSAEHAITAFTRNDYQPDVCFWEPPKAAAITATTFIHPVPDFIIEVLSESTAAVDRGLKFDDYASHGVGEYWIVDPESGVVEQFKLAEGRYELVGRFGSGELECLTAPGLVVAVAAVFDDAANLQAVRAMIGD